MALLLGCVGALALGASSAQAGTVTLVNGELRMEPVDEFGGQENVVDIGITLDEQDMVINDSAGIPSPIPPNCIRISFTQIHCPFVAISRVVINLGLGNDGFSTKEPPRLPRYFDLDVDGGGGNDTITGLHPLGSRSAYTAPVPLSRPIASTLTGGDGNDTIIGGDDPETLRGNAGKDKLAGNAGNDRIFGGSVVDSILGGSGRDFARGGKGNDRGDGGPGNDDFQD